MREKNFENKIKAELKIRGAYFIKYWGGGPFTKAGIPDLLVCYKGRFLGIEVKSDKGKQSKLQEYHLEQIRKAGGIGVLLYPVDYGNFLEMLDDM